MLDNGLAGAIIAAHGITCGCCRSRQVGLLSSIRITLQVEIHLGLEEVSAIVGIVGDVMEEDRFAGETVAPVVGAIPQIGNGIGQSPTLFVVIANRVAGLLRGGIDTVPRGISILHRVQPGIGIAVIIQQIARIRHDSIRGNKLSDLWVIVAGVEVDEPATEILLLAGETAFRGPPGRDDAPAQFAIGVEALVVGAL